MVLDNNYWMIKVNLFNNNNQKNMNNILKEI